MAKTCPSRARTWWLCFTGLAFVTCHGHGADDIEHTVSNLWPGWSDQAMAGALAATQVTSTSNGIKYTVGSSPGEFSVSDDGQAKYSIPVWTANGMLDVEPKLEINYDSGRGSGPLGVGFALVGFPLSQISRCKQAMALDGDNGPISFNEPRFCLDGQRLIPVGPGEYRTEHDSFSKILATGPVRAPTSFTVYTRAGLVLKYGTSANSRLSGPQLKWTADDASMAEPQATNLGTVTLTWALDSVRDRAGALGGGVTDNVMNVTYLNQSVTSERYTAPFTFAELLPQRIDYAYRSGVARRYVKLLYKPRPDARYSFITGLGIAATQQLVRIEAYGPNPTSTALLRSYDLSYDGGGIVSHRPRLSAVTECDQFTVCMPPTTFGWEDGSNMFSDTMIDPFNASTAADDGTLIVRDLDGDGRDDVVWSQPYPTPAPDAGNTSVMQVPGGLGRFVFQRTRQPVDPKVVIEGGYQTEECISLTNIFWWYANDTIASAEAVDLNMDGKAELAMLDLHTTRWSSGSCFGLDMAWERAPQWFTMNLVGDHFDKAAWDVNPDLTSAQGDPVYNKAASDPIVTTNGCYFLCTQGNPNRYPLYFADLDGDGLPEAMEAINTTINGVAGTWWHLRQNTAGKLGLRTPVASYFTRPADKPNSYAADIDASGRHAFLYENRHKTITDPPVLGGSPDTVGTRYLAMTMKHNGTRLVTGTTLLTASKDANRFHYIFLDVNGDGLTDALEVNNTSLDGTSGTGPRVLHANTGLGFTGSSGNWVLAVGSSEKTYLFNLELDPGIRVADMNQDGLPDLVFLGAVQFAGVESRAGAVVLASATGTGTAALMPSNPIMLTNGKPIPLAAKIGNNYGSAQIGDINGDGLIDIVERPVDDPGHIHAYLRAGSKADQLTKITEGTGHSVDVLYRPLSDSSAYRDTPQAAPPPPCDYPLSCVAPRGMWVVKTYWITNDVVAQQSLSLNRFDFIYAAARSDVNRGFLGFAQRTVIDRQTGAVTVTNFDNSSRVGTAYPKAGHIVQQGTILRETQDGIWHRRVTTNHYDVRTMATSPVYSVRMDSSGTVEDILLDDPIGSITPPPYGVAEAELVFDQSRPHRLITSAVTTQDGVDNYNNVTDETTTSAKGTKTYTHNVYTNDSSNWLIGLLSSTQSTSTTPDSAHQTRTTALDYHPGTKFLKTRTVEPMGDDTVRSVIAYTRGPGGFGQVTQTAVTAKVTADDPAGSPPGMLTRTDSLTYDAVDGVTPSTKTNALGQVYGLAYHGGLGVLVTAQDPNGNENNPSYQYDGFGRQRLFMRPGHATVTTSYELPMVRPSRSVPQSAYYPVYAIHTTVDHGGERFVAYNQEGHPILTKSKKGDGTYDFILIQYNNQGQVIGSSRPFLDGGTVYATGYQYDNLGRVVKVTEPGPEEAARRYDYVVRPNDVGTIVRITEPLGNYRDTFYDDLGRVTSSVSITEKSPEPSAYVYGPFSVLEKVFPPAVKTAAGTKRTPSVTMTYDVLGRRTSVTDSNAGNRTTSYSAFSEVVKDVDAKGQPTSYTRDALGRMTKRSSVINGAPRVDTFTWDTVKVGLLSSSTSADGVTESYGYMFGRPNLVTWTYQNESYQFYYGYDPYDHMASISYPMVAGQQMRVKLLYDQAGKLSGVSRLVPAPIGPTLNEVPLWQVGMRDYEDRIYTEKFLDSNVTTYRLYRPGRGWVDSLSTLSNPPGNTFAQWTDYDHDANGNVIGRHDRLGNVDEGFVYNRDDMLDRWTFTSPAGSWSTDFRTQASGVVGVRNTTGPNGVPWIFDHTTAGPHAVGPVSGPGANFPLSYDGNGNQTLNQNQASFQYSNPFDLPSQVSMPNGTVVSFGYDANGQRFFKDSTYTSQKTLYISGLYEKRIQTNGSVRHIFSFPGPGRIIGQQAWFQDSTGVHEDVPVWFHDDIIGSLDASSSRVPSTNDRYKYDPFGKRIALDDPTITRWATPSLTTLGFAAHEMDDELSLINMNGRLYDPFLARFLTPDPEVQSPFVGKSYDRYAYAFNNPLRITDPSGFDGEETGGGEDGASQIEMGPELDHGEPTGGYWYKLPGDEIPTLVTADEVTLVALSEPQEDWHGGGGWDDSGAIAGGLAGGDHGLASGADLARAMFSGGPRPTTELDAAAAGIFAAPFAAAAAGAALAMSQVTAAWYLVTNLALQQGPTIVPTVLEAVTPGSVAGMYGAAAVGGGAVYMAAQDAKVLAVRGVPSARIEALRYAIQLRTAGGRPPRAASAAVDLATGKVFLGHSDELPRDFVPALRLRLPGPSMTPWRVSNCAEISAANKAVSSGASLESLEIFTAKTKTLQAFPRCLNCRVTTAGARVTSD